MFQASLYGALLFNPEHHTRPGDIAGGLVLLVLPYSLLGPFVGVFLDRWRRQRILVNGATLHGGFAATTAVLLATTGSHSPGFDVAAFGALAVNRFYLAALSASLPHVVPEERLVLGNAFSTTAGTVLTIVGAGLGLGVRHFSGAGDHGNAAVAGVSFLGYLVAASIATRLPADELGPDEVDTRPIRQELAAVIRELTEGARHVWQRRPAARALAVIYGQRALFGLWTLESLLLYRNSFHSEGYLKAGLVGAGQAATAAGVGLVLAALITPRLTERIGLHRWIAISTAIPAATVLAFGLPFSLPLFIASATALGFAMQATKVCVDTAVQENVEDDFRGRAFAIYDAGANTAFAVVAVVGAYALPLDGRSSTALVIMSAAYLLLAIAYAASSREALVMAE